MKIELNELNIVSFDDKRHFKFVREMSMDKEIKKYLPDSLEIYIMASAADQTIENTGAYVIENKENPIGFVQIFSSFRDTYSINYGLHPKYRNQGYGKMLLDEVSGYLLDNKCRRVKLNISDMNTPSIKCALSSGYNLETVIASCVNVYVKEK